MGKRSYFTPVSGVITLKLVGWSPCTYLFISNPLAEAETNFMSIPFSKMGVSITNKTY